MLWLEDVNLPLKVCCIPSTSNLNQTMSIHPFINFHLSKFVSWGQQPEQGLRFPGYLLQLFWRKTEVFPGQLRARISPAWLRSTSESPRGWTYLKYHLREASQKVMIFDSTLSWPPVHITTVIHLSIFHSTFPTCKQDPEIHRLLHLRVSGGTLKAHSQPR